MKLQNKSLLTMIQDLASFSSFVSPLCVMLHPVTEHVSLHGKSLCKNMARGSGGVQIICIHYAGGHKRKRPVF